MAVLDGPLKMGENQGPFPTSFKRPRSEWIPIPYVAQQRGGKRRMSSGVQVAYLQWRVANIPQIHTS
jgi:hypothetical protein